MIEENNDGITASDFVFDNMKFYMNSVIGLTFSSCVDGLCFVGRRILLSSSDSTSNTRLIALIGKVMDMHVAGDKTIKESMDNNVQPWKTHIPLLAYYGNFGTYSGDQAAAPRYLNDVRMSDIARDVFFKYTDMNVLPMIPTEAGNSYEPKYFIPCIPAALVSNNQAMAPGFRFLTLPISINSACNLVDSLIKVKTKNPLWNKRRSGSEKLIQHLIPDLPVPTLVRNFKHVYKSYMNGEFNTPIVMDGVMEVTKDTIIVRTIPTGEIIHKQRQIEQVEMHNSSSWFNKHFIKFDGSAETKFVADHTYTVKRNQDPFELIDLLKKFYGFTQTLKQFPNWLNVNGERQEMTQIQILESWYSERYRAVCNQLRIEQNKLLAQIRRYNVFLMVLDNLETIKSIFVGADSPEDAVNEVVSKIPDLTKAQARFIFEMNFKSLTKSGRKEYEDKITQLKEKLKQCNDDILNVDDVLIRQAKDIKKNYGKISSEFYFHGFKMDDSERNSKLPNFKYICCVRGIGYIQCRDYKEVSNVCLIHESTNVKIIKIDESIPKYYFDLTDKLVSDSVLDFPQIFSGKCFTQTNTKLKNIITVDRLNGLICVVDRITFQRNKLENREVVLVGDDFYAISSDGCYNKYRTLDLPIRKSFGASGNLTDIRFVYDYTDNDMYIVYGLKSQPNTIVFEKIELGCKTGATEGSEVLYYGNEDEIVISITEGFNKTLLKHLFANGVKNLFKNSNRVNVNLSTLKASIEGIKIKSESISRNIKHIWIE